MPALRIRPDAARALVLASAARSPCARPVSRSMSRDVIAGERRVVDVAARRGGDAVRSGAARRVPDFHVAGGGSSAAVIAALAGKPHAALAIERERVEIRVAGVFRQRPFATSCVFGSTRTMAFWPPSVTQARRRDRRRRRAAPSRGPAESPRSGRYARIEDAELAGTLRRVVDRPACGGRRGDVVRTGTGSDVEIRWRSARDIQVSSPPPTRAARIEPQIPS